VIVDLEASNRWQAIDELINHLVASGSIKPEHCDPITKAITKREAAMSTGIGHGIALPHAASDLVHDVVGVLGRSKLGIDFDSLDKKPVNLVFLFLVPQGQFQKHLYTLASMAKLLHNAELRDALTTAPSAAAAFGLFDKYGFSNASRLVSARAST
jgi:mannitol/fructose-specific phosphotransferase system IIA component (Ntr-type)